MATLNKCLLGFTSAQLTNSNNGFIKCVWSETQPLNNYKRFIIHYTFLWRFYLFQFLPKEF